MSSCLPGRLLFYLGGSAMNDLRQAYERMAAGLQKPIFNTAVRLAGNVEDGLDIARETFVRGYALYLAGMRSGPFRSWLYGVLFEVYEEYRSHRAIAPAGLDVLARAEEFAGTDSRLEMEIFSRGDILPVELAIKLLPEELRATYLLCDVEGFPYSVIAQILKRPRTVVAEQVYQSRRVLRAALRERPPRRPPIER